MKNTTKNLKEKFEQKIRENAYLAEINKELSFLLPLDEKLLKYEECTLNGKAFAYQEAFTSITGEIDTSVIFLKAQNEARKDIQNANYDIEKILGLANYDGKSYLETYNKISQYQ